MAGCEHKIPPGYLGNLTDTQEAKLRALWAIALKFIEFHEADSATNAATTLEEKLVPPAQKRAGGKKKAKTTHDKYPRLVNELLSLLPTEERNMKKLARRAVDALDYWTPHMYRLIVLRVVKHEHPDALALRFLRVCNWDIIDATVMMGKTIYWRTMDAAVDDDILKHGEGGAAEDEKNGQGHARLVGADFMKQMRCGKAFIHGTDREGRPIAYIRVRLHRAKDQSVEALHRYMIHMLEMARLAIRQPVEMGTILIDVTNFGLSNLDFRPLLYLLKCLSDNYPESIGLILLHNTPYGTELLWQFIRVFINPAVASKVRFTRGKRGLKKYIEPSQIIKELGGDEYWRYQYEEPVPDENMRMQNTSTRDCLYEERRVMGMKFEELTQDWVMTAQHSEKAQEISKRRDQLVDEISKNYWELDPYVRARSLYDRQGHFRGPAGVKWYPSKLDDESFVSSSTLERRSSKWSSKRSSMALATHHETVNIVVNDTVYETVSIAGSESCYESD